MKTAIYLRKSRADEELEKKGENETLSRHRSTLMKIAKEKNLNIVEIKEEVVSGESVSHRPKMLELLEEIKSKKYDSVLVMDIDRLGRGNMQDQGLILETFKQSKTKIITPRKTYDLTNEWDEEYSEFEAFMARKELKLITRRMQRGRLKSIEEGKYIAQTPPFGYKFVFDENGKKSMAIDKEKSEIVKLIYDMYLNENMGSHKIAGYLTDLGYKTTTGLSWYDKGVRDILKNKTYAGYVVWNRVERKSTKSTARSQDEQLEAVGLHEAIVSEETWSKVQKKLTSRTISPTPDNKKLTNPLAGLIKCSSCGHTMVGKFATTKKYGYVKYIKCTYCKDVSSTKLNLLEDEIINALYGYLDTYKITAVLDNNNETHKSNALNQMLNSLKKEYNTLISQKENLHDFLERGIYDVDTYLERSRVLTDKIEINKNSIKKIENDITAENENSLDLNEAITSIENVLELYSETDNALEKNNLLKSVLDSVIYYKEPKRKNVKFEIDLNIKLS